MNSFYYNIIYTVVHYPDIFPHFLEVPMDYNPQSATLTFRKCDRRSCVNISVVDDSELER